MVREVATERERYWIVLGDVGIRRFDVRLAVGPGMVLWYLSDPSMRCEGLLINGDKAHHDFFELAAFVRVAYPNVPVTIVMSNPLLVEFEQCRVIDRAVVASVVGEPSTMESMNNQQSRSTSET